MKPREPRNAERDAEWLRRWQYEGVTLRELANQYGMSISGVSRAVNRVWEYQRQLEDWRRRC